MLKGLSNYLRRKGMSEIVIRHAELRDLDALRQINAQPEVYHNTLQIPHPSLEMWEERMKHPPSGRKSLVACIDDVVMGHLVLSVEPNPMTTFFSFS